MKKRHALWAGALAAGLLLAACGGGSGGSTSGASSTPSATGTVESPTPEPTDTSGEPTIAMEDNHFQPSALSVASGAELELDNEGQNSHTFTIDGKNIDVQVDAGKNAKVTLSLDPGTYPFHCRFHQSLGMTGTLTIT